MMELNRSPAVATAVFTLALALSGCGGDLDARMAEVRALQDVGQYEASIDELRQVLAIEPDLAEATYRLGVALVQTGEPSRAVWALEKAAEDQEYAIRAALLLASAHFSQHNFEASIRAADRALQVDPDQHAALRIRAKANVGAARFEEALADARRLVEIYPDDYGVQAIYASVLTDVGQLDEARTAHDRLKETALAGSDPSIAHRGCIAPAIFARDQLADETLAGELFDDCTERFPSNAFVIGEAVRFYDRTGDPEKATKLIRRSVEEAPENLSLRSHLGTRLRNRGDFEGAEQVFRDSAESFESAGSWNLLANFYRLQDRPSDALVAIEKVAELSGGGSDRLRFAQADLLIDLGDYARAEEIAATLEEPTYARLLRGRVALDQNDPKRALEYFEQGIRSWPNNAGARYLAGRAALELGDTSRAMSEFRESMRIDNMSTPASESLARLHYEMGDYNDALQIARMAQRRLDVNLPNVLTVVARSFTALGQYDDARQVVEILLARPDTRLTGAEELATIEMAAEGPSAAVASIETSGLDLSAPENDTLLRSWVDAMLAASRGRAALRRLDRIVADHPDQPANHELRGLVLLNLGRDQEAAKALETSIALEPDYAPGHAGLANLSARRNDIAAAVARYDKAFALTPLVSPYAYSAAQLSFASGDLPGAETRLREVVRRFPSHAGARNDLAWLLAEKGEDLDNALALAEDAQRLEPSPEILDTLGWVRFRRGEYPAAVAALEQAVEARNDSASMRYRLGVALSRNGDSERARTELQAALETGNFPESEDARRELAQLAP